MLAAEGHVYQRQRRVLLPAFSNHNLRGFVPLVLKKSMQLKEKWLQIMKERTSLEPDAAAVMLNLNIWTSRLTFDVMGLAGKVFAHLLLIFSVPDELSGFVGFDYNFNAVEDESNELLQAYMEMFQKCAAQQGLFSLICLYSPFMRWLFVSYGFPLGLFDSSHLCQA